MPQPQQNDAAVSERERQLRLRAEHAEARMAELFSTMPQAYLAIDRNWTITFANQEAAVANRMPIENFGGAKLWTLWSNLVGTEVDRQFRLAMESRVPVRFEYYSRNYDAWFELNVHPTQEGIGVYYQDVTQRRCAERALIQSEKLAAVGRLASSISHEINNPLESITNLLYLAAGSDRLPADVRDYLNTAQDELARVSQISTQSLRFHRQTVKPTMVSTADLMNSVVDLYRGRLLNSGIRVQTKYTSALRILCFENDIRQVLNNLIANAFDAMRRGGRMLLRTHDATDSKTGRKGVRLTVADTGRGISPQARKRLFEAFYTTKELNGTGLGLWISRGIAVRHDGHLTLRSSDRPGRSGTVFTLFLPERQDTDAVPEQAPSAAPKPRP